MMNPDFAIVLNFKTTGDFDADFLVKTARNIGVRAVMSDDPDAFKAACDRHNGRKQKKRSSYYH